MSHPTLSLLLRSGDISADVKVVQKDGYWKETVICPSNVADM